MTPRPSRECCLRFVLLHAPLALAADPPKLDAANTAWMITATVLVLFMTLPGLALFYAGLVRTKNVLSVLMQCFAITCVVTLAWVVVALQHRVRRRRRRQRVVGRALQVLPVGRRGQAR